MDLSKPNIICWIILLAVVPTIFAQTEQWKIVGEMPNPVAGGQAVVHDSKIFILGGYSDASKMPTDLIQVYDPETGLWEIAGRMQAQRALFSCDFYQDSLFIFGGATDDSTKALTSETWSFDKDPVIYDQKQIFNRIGAAGIVYDNSVFIIGGYSDDPIWSAGRPAYIVGYNIPERSIIYETDSLFVDDLPYQQFAARYNEMIYLFGGVSPNVSNKVFRFNANTHNYEKIFPNLQRARAGGQAVHTENGLFYLIGGYEDKSAPLASVERYQVTDFGFINDSTADLTVARKELMAVYYDHFIYVFGGMDDDNKVITKIERMDLVPSTAVVEQHSQVEDFKLENAYPNPFNAATVISLSLQKKSRVRLEVFSITGRLVKTLASEELPSGQYRFSWDGIDENQQSVASGVYICRLFSDYAFTSQKITLLR
jgi:hypothetical protein